MVPCWGLPYASQDIQPLPQPLHDSVRSPPIQLGGPECLQALPRVPRGQSAPAELSSLWEAGTQPWGERQRGIIMKAALRNATGTGETVVWRIRTMTRGIAAVVIAAPTALHRGRGANDSIGGRGPCGDVATGSGGSGVCCPREPIEATFLPKGHLFNGLE